MTDIRQDPAYHQGFRDAGDLEPLFEGASPAYAAGWRAYWEMRELLEARATTFPGVAKIFVTSNP